MKLRITIDDIPRIVEVSIGDEGITATVDGASKNVDAIRVPGGVNLRIDGHVFDVVVVNTPEGAFLSTGRTQATAQITDQNQPPRRQDESTHPPAREFRAPMPGRIIKVCVTSGDEVVSDQSLVVIEAMKMENELRTSTAGTVDSVEVAAGDNVERDAVLVRFR